MLALASPALAQNARDLAEMSIEELMRIEITSVSRRQQRASDAAAAVFVISRDDIRRSGMKTIPDVLRLAPGVNVAQINANKWAVSARGFNGLYANRLLVLVDGRSIYTRLFAGVLWDTGDLLLDDIDRIEVIRGPGAALWGANAVNGVINIITRSAADTLGGLVRVDGGTAGLQGAIRYGGTIGAAKYRVYGQWTDGSESVTTAGRPAGDDASSITTGFRADWSATPGAFMLQGAATAGTAQALWQNLDPLTVAVQPLSADPSETWAAHVLGQWTHTRGNGASLEVQTFADFASRNEPVGRYRRQAFDVDTQYQTRIGARHEVVAGAGYRFTGERFDGGVGFSLTPELDRSSLVTAFVQDEIGLFSNRLSFTLGSQVQYDSISGLDVQPTARVMWKAFPQHRVWAATSRAVRTPSLVNRGLRIDYTPVPGPGGLPLFVTALGNPAFKTERHVNAEVGYRVAIGSSAAIDVVGFIGSYDDLSTTEPGAPIVQFVPSPRVQVNAMFGNEMQATTRGVEIAAQWSPLPAWRLDGSYTGFRLDAELSPTSLDFNQADADGNAPRGQWQLRSGFVLGSRGNLDIAVFRVGRLQRQEVGAYTRADINAEWRVTSDLSLIATGQNLLDDAHAEDATATSLLLSTEVRRSVGVRMRWRFR
jgi:iron complex outermembrane receptor protein